MAKAQLNAGRRRELYYFRDQQGLEVDFVVPIKAAGCAWSKPRRHGRSRRATLGRCSDWRRPGAAGLGHAGTQT